MSRADELRRRQPISTAPAWSVPGKRVKNSSPPVSCDHITFPQLSGAARSGLHEKLITGRMAERFVGVLEWWRTANATIAARLFS